MDFTECYMDSVSSVAAAARSGHIERVRKLIHRGFSVDSRDNRGWNALHEAAAAGTKECVKEILSTMAAGSSSGCRAYVNSLTHEGESALYLAAQHGRLPVVRLLLKAHADINQLTNDLSCPLYAAVDGGHKEIVELLVRRGAEVNGTHTASYWTCLHKAAYKGYSNIVRILVRVCNLETLDDHKITPLFVAAQYGQQQCLEILVDAGANVNAQASDLATPLMIASQEGHEGCVKVLLDHGADPNLSCSLDWPQLPIHAAAQFGRHSILKRLIAVTDRVCDRGEGRVSPLYHAVVSQSVELFLTEGYSPDAQDCTHILGFCSPLAYALYLACDDEPDSTSVSLLIGAGASLTEQEWMYALATEKADLLQLILQHRRIPGPERQSRACSRPDQLMRTVLKQEELRDLLCVALSQVHFASCWLPLLLQAGLEPALLLQPYMLEKADSEVLNYLLEFVNWSTLSPPLKHILDQRLEERTWTPHAHFECIPTLSHLCRLQVRKVLGCDVVMGTTAVRELPVPPLLQSYLLFAEVQRPSYTHSPPPPLSDRMDGYRSSHMHRHVL